jgi:hypothetical protein
MTNARTAPPPIDSLLSVAKRVGLPVAVPNSRFWRNAFGQYLDQERSGPSEGAPDHDIDYDDDDPLGEIQASCRENTAFLSRQSSGLLIVAVTQTDSAAHRYGGRSEEYRQMVGAADECVKSFVTALDDGNTTFLVTSDHGHIDLRGHGGHGGLEDEVINVPLVLAGKGIRASRGWRAEQVDIAPSICALLGLPLPASSQGRILWQALDVPPGEEPALRARENEQRALAASHFPNLDQLRDQEKRARSLPALAIFTCLWFLGCATLLGNRGRWHWLLAAAAIYYAVFYVLFNAFGLQYSLSAINRREYLVEFVSKDLAAATLSLFVASIALRRPLGLPGSRLLLDFGLLVGCTLAIQATWVYYEHGLFMDRAMPDLRNAFKAYLDLMQLAACGSVACSTALLHWLATRWAPAPSPLLERESREMEQEAASAD